MARAAISQVSFHSVGEQLPLRCRVSRIKGLEHSPFGAIPVFRLHRVVDAFSVDTPVAPNWALALDEFAPVAYATAVRVVSPVEDQVGHVVTILPLMATVFGDGHLFSLISIVFLVVWFGAAGGI